tara:strand:- start:510 stop:1205 length:696 start_codon:yes stop_codon:yes gene_type:complete
LARKLLFPVGLGLFGVTILCMLGTWQINRLNWKNSLINEVINSISMEPQTVELENIDINSQYLSVVFEGQFLEDEIHVLFSLKPYGPGFKIIKPFKLKSDEIILVDLGFVKERDKNINRKIKETKIMGNIFFPNETDYFTPSPNFTKNIWFSRDLEKMSSFLNSSPRMLILSSDLDISNIVVTPLNPNFVNNHLQYSVTWFSMAVSWLFMSVYLISRVVSKHRKVKNLNVL